AQLRPAREAGTHAMAQVVVAQVGVEFGHELRPLRARADDAHVAPEDVPQLRELVQAGAADDPPTRVMRSSSLPAQRATPSCSASVRMLRNLISQNTEPSRPTRSCRYRIGCPLPDSMRIASATSSSSGQVSASTASEAMTSIA